jgi:segregation and condensation protein B
VDTENLRALEAILFLASEPVGSEPLAAALEVTVDEVDALLDRLAHRLDDRGAGLELGRAGGGWRLYTRASVRERVERFLLAGRTGRLSPAAIETLAVVAYKQPISRARIGDIRGVNADGAVRSLVTRGLIAEVGRDDGPGQAVLYGTASALLEQLGIDSIEDLPPLTAYLPEGPAPDEPAADRLRAARQRLAQDVPLTSRRSQDADMDELSGELERAARSAAAQLRRAVAATEQRPADPEEPS